MVLVKDARLKLCNVIKVKYWHNLKLKKFIVFAELISSTLVPNFIIRHPYYMGLYLLLEKVNCY